MRLLCCVSFVVVLLTLFAAGPARATFDIGGDLVVIPNIVVFEIRPFDPTPELRSTGLVYGSLTDGFGNTVALEGGPQLPIAGAGVDLSQSLSSAGGTASSQTTLLSALSAGINGTTLQVTSSVVSGFPTAISLSQTDLDLFTPNDPATLLLTLLIPFQSDTANVFFDFDFDVSSNIPALTATDAFTLESCVYSGDYIGQFVVLSDFASACAAEGGTAVTRASLGSGTALPVVDPVAAYSDVVTPGVQNVAAFGLSFQIKNDTGPTTLSLDNFVMTMSSVPEPGVALLLAVGLLAVRGRRASTPR